MANYGAVENCIEWLRGTNTVTLSLSDPEVMEKVLGMAEKDVKVEIIERSRFTLCARMPLAYVTLKRPRNRKDADENSSSGHSAKAEASRKKGEVLRKRRIPPRS